MGGVGALVFGGEKIVGADAGGGRYAGTYTQQPSGIALSVNLTMPKGGVLVTGQQVLPGTSIPISGTWPANFANGPALSVNVAGKVVQVVQEKIGDVP